MTSEDRRRQADALLDLYDAAGAARPHEAKLDRLVKRLVMVVQARQDGWDVIPAIDGMPTDLELRTAALEERESRRRFEEAWARCLCLGLESDDLTHVAEPHRDHVEDEPRRRL